MTFLDELVKKGILKEDQLPEIVRLADEKYKGNIDQALIDFKVDENKVLELKGAYFNIPTRTLDSRNVPSNVLKYIPLESAQTYNFSPIGVTDGVLEIGITDPENIQAMDVLQFLTVKNGMPFKVFLISFSTLQQLLESYRGTGGEVDKALTEFDDDISKAIADTSKEDIVAIEKKKDESKEDLEKIVEDAPIIKIVGVILRNATEGNASDIHIENVGDKVKVRFRVDGVLHTTLILPLNVYSGVIARIKILAKLRLDEKRKPQDGGFSTKIDDRKIDFRVSTMPSYFGEKIVMRILDSQRGIKPLNQLDLSEENLALIREALTRSYGLILVTGPTGSGKTTTLYSMLNSLDREEKNIVSLEDPVEYQITGINQSQVMPEIGYTFASGLRSILRQDPDIIMVGEIRDKETAQLAIQAALTGHLVFSTLHTNSAVGAIPRLIDMGIDPYLIAPTLILAVAQRLVRRVTPQSRKAVSKETGTRVILEKQFVDLPEEFKSKIDFSKDFIEAIPSNESPSGTRGRVPVFEIFKIDKEMQSVILKNPTEQDVYKLARSRGMITMKEDAMLKSLDGMVPFQDIFNL